MEWEVSTLTKGVYFLVVRVKGEKQALSIPFEIIP